MDNYYNVLRYTLYLFTYINLYALLIHLYKFIVIIILNILFNPFALCKTNQIKVSIC